MTAYMIAEITVVDPAAMTGYRRAAATSIVEYGGVFLVRGGEIDQKEGERPGGESVVVVAFPSLEVARAWYGSAAYAEALAMKDAAMRRRVTFVDGVAPPS